MKSFKNFFILFYKNIKRDLEELSKRNEFVFNSVNLLYYKFHKLSLNRGGSYIDSSKWLKNKKATISSKHNDNKC